MPPKKEPEEAVIEAEKTIVMDVDPLAHEGLPDHILEFCSLLCFQIVIYREVSTHVHFAR